MQELIIILIIVVVLFGSTRLPQVGEGVGKMITNFRKSMKQAEKAGQDDDDEEPPKKEIPGA
ncbi:MAG TPA: twin-arginine translocase TatA/TatE family subunit [bacterium]|nr:twin-arginine translocase TatA/TatE family subunit [bacterium]